MSSHTPGPWQWEVADGSNLRLCNASGAVIVDGWDEAGVKRLSKEDANLIAAAPDMLAALQVAEQRLAELNNSPTALSFARAAIAKAIEPTSHFNLTAQAMKDNPPPPWPTGA